MKHSIAVFCLAVMLGVSAAGCATYPADTGAENEAASRYGTYGYHTRVADGVIDGRVTDGRVNHGMTRMPTRAAVDSATGARRSVVDTDRTTAATPNRPAVNRAQTKTVNRAATTVVR